MKRCIAFLIGVFLLINLSWAVELNLPKRPNDAMGGLEFKNYIEQMNLTDRENTVLSAVTSGNIPDFLRNLQPVTVSSTFHFKKHTATYYVTPDYLAIGTDTDYFLIPLTPVTAQKLADILKCNLPTRKMVNQIWSAAKVKLEPSPIPPSPLMITIPVMWSSNTIVGAQRAAFLKTNPLGDLVGGDKKDVVVTARFATMSTKVAIYGWHHTTGVNIQPLYLGHGNYYADYSHGIRLVDMKTILDGETKTIPEVLQDPISNVLLSDEGVVTTYRYDIPANYSFPKNVSLSAASTGK